MLDDDFAELVELYQEASQGKRGSIEEIFQKSLAFIERLKKELVSGDEEDKKAAIQMIQELYKYMKGHSKMLAEKSGMTEEELLKKSGNPANFTKEQWKKLEESKATLKNAGEELSKLLHSQKRGRREKAVHPSPLKQAETAKKLKKKSKKSKWMQA